MQSIIHRNFGEPVDVLESAEMPKPEPKAGEVRIKMILSPIHNHDVWTVRGNYGYKPTLPAIGGSEGVGVIDALGEGVEQLSLGQRVAVAAVHGSWAEYFIAPAHGVVPLVDTIDDETAAQLIGMPISALMLLDFIDLQKDHWLIQNTANGAVGKTVAMIAQARGQKVIHLVRRREAIAEMNALGIENVVATDQADWKQQVKAIHADQPLMAGVDSIGGKASGEMLALLSENSVLVSFGSMTGELMQISSGDLIFKQAVVKGFWASVVNKQLSKERKKALIVELLTLAAQKKLVLPVEGIFSFDQIKQAASKATQGARQGKVLLKP
ncbi:MULTISPECIES: zinc-binding dehydrogenase [Acinetobacter]|jgi:NADPH2:quinone reductase|uniref:enoyl-[acyl-carrier-protein] reductase n=1 Tax=Acinetobacter bereziniae TaxID=106648 RepID=A0A8B5S7D4_ACIBZ|nr:MULTISPECIES: zinc-binding dehydrogenase [Acinetobacter]MBJ9947539.1 zinc-binding dehydrogenase [Acinetobacter bereziniae]MCM8512509.1 zinc-binding dehydrogenase [Acinetobacter bereziniae]MDR3030496.1 zinc-binding dehydrogenase [Acinetobacter sp.]MDV8156296.1 zinc-binding dehydrogenase [Acinetobacter bereziniae]QQC83295.1 zinc-binding dehydrogenase [Acinetobacter bereziniae]